MCTGSRATIFALPNESLLPISTLGKVSKAKMQSLFEQGAFAEHVRRHEEALELYGSQNRKPPSNESEALLLQDFADLLGINAGRLGVDTPTFDMGFTSMDMIRLKRRLDVRLT
jgi:hypothetical protein